MSIHNGDGATLRWTELDIQELSEEQKHKASLYVCENAEDAGDARLLLQMMGLVESEKPKVKIVGYERRPV